MRLRIFLVQVIETSMATDGYERIVTSDVDLPPPAIISEPTDTPIPVSFPSPPASPVTLATNDVTASKSKPEQPSGIKGVQLVKVSGLKADEEELSLQGITEGELFLASEAVGVYEQWQVWKPVMDAEKKFMPRKFFIPIEKGKIPKQEKHEIVLQSIQSQDSVLLEACLAQSLFTPLQKGLAPDGGCLYHLAAVQGSPQQLLYVISRKIGKPSELLQRDSNGCTLLHVAANACKTESVEVILDHVVSSDHATATELINAQNNACQTALAVSIQHQNREAVNLLLRTGICNLAAVDRDGETVFHLAVRLDDVEIVTALTQAFLGIEPLQESKIGLKNTITKQSATGSIPITLAQSSEMIRLLLPNYELNSAEYANQSTLLHLSVNNNNLLLTEALLENGVDTNSVNSLGHTPLMQACRAGNKEITAMLLERHADPEQVLKSSGSECDCTGTAIEMAALNGHLECVKLLLQFNATVNGEESTVTNRIGALHASCFGGDEQMVDFFLREQGMDANLHNSSGYTPLFYAVKAGHFSVTELLLSCGADPSLPIPQTPGEFEASNLLHLVIEQDYDKLFALLLSHSKVDDTSSLVELAVRLDRKKLMPQLLTTNQDILQSGRHTGSLLHTVVANQAVDCLAYILKRLAKSCSPAAIHFQLFERKAIFVATKPTKDKFTVTSQKSVFELALDQQDQPILRLLLSHLRDQEYFQNNKALLHSMMDKQLYSSLKAAMDTMVECKDGRVTLQTCYLDSDSTGLLPTNPDYIESDSSLLHKIAACPDQDIVYHPSVAAAVAHKLPYYRILFAIAAFLYLIFLLLLTLALHRASYLCDIDLFDYQKDPFRLFCEIVIGVYFVLYIAYEVLNFLIEWDPLRGRYIPADRCTQSEASFLVESTSGYRMMRLLHSGLKSHRHLGTTSWHKLNGVTRGLFSAILAYFTNVFRLLAFLSLCFLFLFFMLRLGISSSQWTFAALALLSFYLSLAEYSKLCPCFYSYMMRVLRATFQSLPYFIILLIICVLAFVLSGHLLVQQGAMQGQVNSTVCVPQQNFFSSLYIGTNRLFVASMALLIQSGLSTYETEFVFRDTNWVLLLFIICFGFVFAILLPAFLLAHILFSFTQHQGSLSVQRCKLDIIYRTELHSGFAFLFGRRIRASTCVREVSFSAEAFQQYTDKVNSERESEILKSIKSQIGRVLYSSQKFLHKKPLSPLADDKQLTADIDTDTNVVSMIEQLRADMQINSRQINKSVTSMFQKMDGLDSRVALIHDYLTGVSVEIVS